MSARQILFQQEARERLLRGVDATSRAVRVTLGPRGRHVLIEKGGGTPTVTKDGVSVAREIELVDRFENMGAQILKEVAIKTSDVVGDGTTTVLAGAIFREGCKLVASGHDPMDLKRGIEKAVAVVVEALDKLSRPARDSEVIARVGTIAANGDETVGQLLAEAMKSVGREGVITVEEARSMESVLEVVEGIQFERGYLSPYFVTSPRTMEVVLEDALILLHEKKVNVMGDLLPLLEQVAKAGKPILVVADDVEGEALATVVVNKLPGNLQCAAIKAPGFGDRRKHTLQDLAVLTGAQVGGQFTRGHLHMTAEFGAGARPRITTPRCESG